MMILKKYRWLITFSIIAIALLAISFFYPTEPTVVKNKETDVSVVQNNTKEKEKNIEVTTESNEKSNKADKKSEVKNNNEVKEKADEESSYNTKEEKTDNDIKEHTNETPAESENTPKEPTDNQTCTLSISCATILNNLEKVKEEKKKIIPPDGIIFPQKKVVFHEGETAFNVLLREMKQNRIHFEFENTPAFNSIYIEGIGNIYEFDAGDLSGWLYKVNGEFLSCSISKYTVKKDDIIEIIYTCNMGADVGGAYASLQ